MTQVQVFLPITRPCLSREEEEAVIEVIRSGWVSQGARVAAFEEAVASYVGARYAVATSSCTTALHLALLYCGIGPGDEVIVPSFTFIATANAVLHSGAKPVFVDIDRRTYNLDPAKVEEAVSPRTRAIIPVDQIGLPADLDAIQDIARRHGLHVVEDAAPAIGARYRGERVGSLSELTCFSFHARKVITTGEGGMITTNNEEMATQARIGRSHGASISDLARHQANAVAIEEYPVLGFNYRMTDIQASIGIQQMQKLDWILERRRTLGERYTAALGDIEGLEPPFVPPDVEHTYQSYCVRITNGRHSRDEVMAAMMERHIATRRGVMAIHLEPYYRRRFGAVSLPVTEEMARTTLLVPLFPTMTEAEQDYVIESLRSVMIR